MTLYALEISGYQRAVQQPHHPHTHYPNNGKSFDQEKFIDEIMDSVNKLE